MLFNRHCYEDVRPRETSVRCLYLAMVYVFRMRELDMHIYGICGTNQRHIWPL